MKKKFFLVILISIFITAKFFPSMILEEPKDLVIPSKRSFDANSQYIKPFKLKKITVAEYITDPLIMYAALWGCFALTLPLWETGSGLNTSHINYWKPDIERGFYKLYDNPYYNHTLGAFTDDTFANRLQMEPFASGRIDPVTKEWNGMTVFRGDIYAKNIIEPVFFTYLALYMRSKNYHPAIMITEVILLSLMYELTIRPFFMPSSFEQLLKNPGIGLVIGILFDELSTFLLSTPYVGLHILGYIFNPFNALGNSRIHPMLFFDPYRKQVSIEAVIEL